MKLLTPKTLPQIHQLHVVKPWTHLFLGVQVASYINASHGLQGDHPSCT